VAQVAGTGFATSNPEAALDATAINSASVIGLQVRIAIARVINNAVAVVSATPIFRRFG
jgi:hypothetical protein